MGGWFLCAATWQWDQDGQTLAAAQAMQEMGHPSPQLLPPSPWKVQHQPRPSSSYPPMAANTFPPLSLPFYSSKFTPHQHITPPRTLSLHTESAVPPSPSSLSHPAPQEDHSKSLPCPRRGSSPGSSTHEPPPSQKDRRMSNATRRGGVSHVRHFAHSLKALWCPGTRHPKNTFPVG